MEQLISLPAANAQAAFATLGHAGRLAVFRLLMRFAPKPVRPTEIAAALDLKANTLSGYLSDLVQAGLITVTRNGRQLFYKADLEQTGALAGYLINDCCRGRPEACPPLPKLIAKPNYRVLFLCSGNSARSIMAEALLRDLGEGRFTALSAGTTPRGEVHPMTLDLLARQGHDTNDLRSKELSEITGDVDFVFTVCDTAASEDCAPWPGQPLTAHWSLPDPVKATGTPAEKALAFAQSYDALRRRIATFAALPVARLDRLALQRKIDDISET